MFSLCATFTSCEKVSPGSVQTINSLINIFALRSYIVYLQHFKYTNRKLDLSKHCRPRSDVGLHFLPFIQHIVDVVDASTGVSVDSFKS